MADHQRVNISRSSMSCGVYELSRLTDDETEGAAFQIAAYLYHPSRGSPCAFICYSDRIEIGQTTASQKLNDLIDTKKWGHISASAITDNPNTGNMIRVYTWCIDHLVFKNWYKEQRIAKLKKI